MSGMLNLFVSLFTSPPSAVQEKIQATKKKLDGDKTSKDEDILLVSSLVSKIFTGFCCVLLVSSVVFYYLPWERYLFSQAELDRLMNAINTGEIRNFLATAEQHVGDVGIHEVPCIQRAYRREARLGGAPKRCGTIISDELLPKDQIEDLRTLASKVIRIAGDTSYANRESINLQWVNLHNLFKRNNATKFLSKKEYGLIRNASIAAKEVISASFEIPEENLHFNLVCQFTRYRSLVKFSEFRHVDKVRSPSLVVTSILWLSTHNVDFGGGITEFLTGPGPEPFSPVIVEPKKGRFAAWTSGFENPHAVTEVFWGNRLALIFAFTASPKLGYKNLDSLRNWAINGANRTMTPKNGY